MQETDFDEHCLRVMENMRIKYIIKNSEAPVLNRVAGRSVMALHAVLLFCGFELQKPRYRFNQRYFAYDNLVQV